MAAGCRARPHCPPCAERGRKATHRSGGEGCTPVRASWQTREERPRSPAALRGASSAAVAVGGLGAEAAGATGVQDVVEGSCRSSSADTMVIPAGAGDLDVSQGSSHRSPSGKKARVTAESSATPHVEEEPRPQLEPRQRPRRPAKSPSGDEVDDSMDVEAGGGVV